MTEHLRSSMPPELLTATVIGKHFEISANKANAVLSELGWIKTCNRGWLVTDLGRRLGGLQSKDRISGASYVRWPKSIMNNKTLIACIHEVKGDIPAVSQEQVQIASTVELEFREKFPANHRATDGHIVRSKAELLVDNWLYMSGIVHAYERKLPVEEEVYSDFYLPTGKVYIEYWGFDADPRYLARRRKKLEVYEKYRFHCIQLTDKEVLNLADIFPRLLLERGIKIE